MELPIVIIRPIPGVSDVTALNTAIEHWSARASRILNESDLDEVLNIVKGQVELMLDWYSTCEKKQDMTTKLELVPLD